MAQIPAEAGTTNSGLPRSPIINRGLMFKTHIRLPGGSPDDTSPIVANMSQPAYAQSWWPCKDKPGDKFLVAMELTVPDTLLGVSNGTLLDITSPAPNAIIAAVPNRSVAPQDSPPRRHTASNAPLM